MPYARVVNRAAQTARNRRWYEANRELALTRAMERSKRNKAAMRQLVNDAKNGPCLDCGLRFPAAVMDFDHRPGEVKLRGVNELVGRNASEATIHTEIAKCDLVCANCHRIRTESRYVRSKRATVFSEKTARYTAKLRRIANESKSGPCADCDHTYPPIAMDFDHRPGEVRIADVARLTQTGSEAKLRAEIAKCDVVCANCHRIRTWVQDEAA